MKRTMATIIAVVVLFSCLFGITACKGRERERYGDDTFEGALSTESFDSTESAVKGFLSNEIAGEATDATLVDYKEKKELLQEEIDKLAMDETDKASVLSAKEVEVLYNRGEVGLKAASDDEDDFFVFTVYILELSASGSEVHIFKYYVPKAKSGDVLTRSYYDDLLRADKYINCTQEYTNSVESRIGNMPFISYEINYVISVTANKAFITMKVIDPVALDDMEVKYINLKGYFEYDEQTNTFYSYFSKDDSPYIMDTTNLFGQYGIVDMQSFATMNLPKIDYSYYEKTDFGFKIQEDFINKYLNMSIQSLLGDVTAECSLNVYVSEGRVGKLESNISFLPQDGFSSVTHETLIFKNFGTTTVETPEGIESLI